jgi:conjugative transfer signal peptidase TraF
MKVRGSIIVAMLSGASMLAFSWCVHPKPWLLWNASASVPVGLYEVHPVGPLRVGQLLIVSPPAPLARFLAARRYLPMGVPLIKHVAALPGHVVCRRRRVITVDGMVEGEALDRDMRGRPLPIWQGCQKVAPREIFLLNIGVPDSLDGRYFGPLPDTTIIGRATPLWLPRRSQ